MKPTTHIFLFGDQTYDFVPDLRRLLSCKSKPILAAFLEQSHYVIRAQSNLWLSASDRRLSRSSSLTHLLQKYCEGTLSPAFQVALHALTQLGSFISHYEEPGAAYPSPGSTYLIGLCTGSLAAAAIASSNSLSELLPAAVHVVQVALRLGLIAVDVRDRIERPEHGQPTEWSMLFFELDEQAAREGLEEFIRAKNVPELSKPFISAHSGKALTITGSPSILRELRSAPGFKHYQSRPIPIFLPAHGRHLFSTNDVATVLETTVPAQWSGFTAKLPVISGASGLPVWAGGFTTLLDYALADCMLEPIRWDKVVGNFCSLVGGSSTEAISITPIATTLEHNLSSSLKEVANVHIRPLDGLQEARFISTPPAKSKLAIVGMSGRFPESPSPEAFWDLLYEGLDVCKEVPAKRWNWRTHVTDDGKGHNLGGTKWGCWLDFADQFDPRFFSISPKEAPQMDPAQRMALMTTYEALQRAGFVTNTTPSSQEDRVGVFHGVTSNDYLECNSGQFIDTYFITGGNRAFIPGRINFCFEFCGPSYTNDTACSSSLAAIHLACNSLWRGDCDTAIAGGTNMCINPDGHTGLDKGFFLSRTGNCKPFDDAADGYCRGEAVATIVIKRLEDALAENDPILGVILDVKTNHSALADSMTRPHVDAQVDNMNAVLATANVDRSDVSYVEMHGTGTQVGDAVEMASVLRVFTPDEKTRTAENPLHVGTVKANIGHGEGVSGISSLCKVLLMMKHNTIPPHCGIKPGSRINRNYPDLPARHVHIPIGPTPWTQRLGRPRRALINNFSAAGGNTALLLEDAPAPSTAKRQPDPRTSHIVTVSGHVAAALKKNLHLLVAYIRQETNKNANLSLPQLSWTTTARRQQHVFRVSATGSSIDEIETKLQAALDRGDGSTRPKSKPRVLFAFTGQGAQYLGMGHQLLEAYPTFRSDIEHFDFMAQGLGFPSFIEIIRQTQGILDGYPPVTVQLATTAIQMALTNLLVSFGIRPHAVTGHSLGLYAALQAAGVLTIADTLFLVGRRAQLLQELCQEGSHAMLALKAPQNIVTQILAHQKCEIACVNGPEDLVISGSIADIQAAQSILASNRLNATLLRVPFAFHSAQVDPVLAPFAASALGAKFRAPAVPVLCPLTGSVVQADGVFSPEYLVRHCREPVNMAGALLGAQSAHVIDSKTFTVEVGPHPVVCGMVRATLGKEMRTLTILQRGASVWPGLTATLQALYESGADLDWGEYHAPFDAAHKVLDLPAYGWDLKSYWIDYENDWCIYKPYGRPSTIESQGAPKALAQASPSIPLQAPRNAVPPPQTSTVHRMVEESVVEGSLRLVLEGDLSGAKAEDLAAGHIVNGIPFTVPSWFADMALVLGKYAHTRFCPQRSVILDVADVVADKVLVPHARGPQPVRVSLAATFNENDPDSLREGRIEFYSVDASGKTTSRHGYGILRFSDNTVLQAVQAGLPDYKSRIQRLRSDVAQGDLMRYNKKSGYRLMSRVADFGPEYKLLDDLVIDEDTLEATCIVNFSNIAPGGIFAAHPGCVDAFTQVGGFAINARGCMDLDVEVFISHGWLGFQLYEELKVDTKYELYVQMQADGHEFYRGDTVVLNQGRLVAFFKGVTVQRMPRKYQKVVTQSLHQATESPRNVNGAVASRLGPSSTKVPAKVQPPVASTPVSVQLPVAKKPPTDFFVPEQPDRLVPAVPTAPAVRSAPSRQALPQSTRTPAPIIAEVMAIVSEESGIATADLTDDSNFADMGIDSLCSMVIGSRLREDLGLDLAADFSMFVSCPTVKQLKDFLLNLDGGSESRSGSEASAILVEKPFEEPLSEVVANVDPFDAPEQTGTISVPESLESSRLPSSSSSITAPSIKHDVRAAAPLDSRMVLPPSSSTPSFSSGPDIKATFAVAVEQYNRYDTGHHSAGPTDRACSSKPRFEHQPQRAAVATPLVQNSLAIVSEESGLSLEDLTDDSNFADIGVDSLCSMVIQSRLREELHVDLDADFSIFINCPTVGDLKSFLVKTEDGDAGAEATNSSTYDPSDTSPITTPEESASDDNAEDEKISAQLALRSSECHPATSVILQGIPKLASKTLFLLPDGSGSATSYVQIPRLSSDVAIVGLNCPYVRSPEEMNCTPAAMVSSFCQEITRRQPSGPYHLGGWSAGGAFAFACASRLIQSGAEVHSLIIIDAPVPRKLGTLPSGFYEYCGRRGLFGNDIPPASLIPHFLRTMETMLPYQAVPLRTGKMPNVGIIWACETVMDADDAPDLGLQMGRDHFMLKRRQEFGPDGWEHLLPDADFTVERLVGADHFTMMQKKHASQIRDLIDHVLGKS